MFVQCRFQVLTECFFPIQRSVTSQTVIETSSPCTYATRDTLQHLLQVCRLTEKTVRFNMGNSLIFLCENYLTFAACQFTLHLRDDVLIQSFAIQLFLLRGYFFMRGGGGIWGFTIGFALLLLGFHLIFGRFFAILQWLMGDWSLASLGLLDLLKLPLLLL